MRPVSVTSGLVLLFIITLISTGLLLMQPFGFGLPFGFEKFFLVSAIYGGPVVIFTAISILFAVLSMSHVLQGLESGRALFLVWTTFSMVAGLSLSTDPTAVLVDTTLRTMVLFFWFLPSASHFFLEKHAKSGAVA